MIEVNQEFVAADTDLKTPAGGVVSITPPVGESYYVARVPLARDQAIQIFPKFFTVGCGFAQEEDWNTNLPLRCPAEQIYAHIKSNKKYEEITDAQCLAAIRELQEWAYANGIITKR